MAFKKANVDSTLLKSGLRAVVTTRHLPIGPRQVAVEVNGQGAHDVPVFDQLDLCALQGSSQDHVG